MPERELKYTLQPIASLLAAITLLNLIILETPLQLAGMLKVWLATYNTELNQRLDFLFGWIDFHWLNISHTEGNVIILSLLLGVLQARGIISSSSETPRGLQFLVQLSLLLSFGFLYGGAAFVLVLLIPYPFGAGIALLLPALRMLAMVFTAHAEDLHIKQQLLTVLALLSLFLGLNFSGLL
jgi:hypothetical protein